jgi:hypothetical protein
MITYRSGGGNRYTAFAGSARRHVGTEKKKKKKKKKLYRESTIIYTGFLAANTIVHGPIVGHQ